MKSLLISLLASVVLFISCNQIGNKSKNNQDKIDSTAIFYKQAENLKGLERFVIDSSTISIIKKVSKEISKDIKYLGIYNFEEITNKKYDWETQEFFCPKLKVYEISKYYIGDIELSKLRLFFFNDTLIKITCDQKSELDDGLSVKYGRGKVKSENIWKTSTGETSIRPSDEKIKNSDALLLKIEEEKIWENKNIIARSYVDVKYKYDDKKYLGADYSTYEFYIKTKNESRIKDMEKCEETAIKDKENKDLQKKNKTYNAL